MSVSKNYLLPMVEPALKASIKNTILSVYSSLNNPAEEVIKVEFLKKEALISETLFPLQNVSLFFRSLEGKYPSVWMEHFFDPSKLDPKRCYIDSNLRHEFALVFSSEKNPMDQKIVEGHNGYVSLLYNQYSAEYDDIFDSLGQAHAQPRTCIVGIDIQFADQIYSLVNLQNGKSLVPIAKMSHMDGTRTRTNFTKSMSYIPGESVDEVVEKLKSKLGGGLLF